MLMLGEGAPALPPDPQPGPETGHPVNTFPIFEHLRFVFGDRGLACLLPNRETQQVPGPPLFGQKNKSAISSPQRGKELPTV